MLELDYAYVCTDAGKGRPGLREKTLERAPKRTAQARPVSARDVARLAGVSQSAVSRAFSNAPGVSTVTRDHILKIAETLDYRPNALASGLITRKSGLVGLVISDLANPFLSNVVDKMLHLLRAHGQQALVFAAESDADLDAAAFELGRYRVDGCFVISPHLQRSTAEKCSRLGPTVLLFNRSVPGLQTSSSVSVDNHAAGAAVAGHLIARGHRSFAFMHGIEEAATDFDRYNGFREKLVLEGFGEPLAACGHFSYEGALETASLMLKNKGRPTAMFCANDQMAMGVLDAARHRLGLDVPGEMAVVGFDDAPTAAAPAYELTTVRQPVDDALSVAMELFETIQNEDRDASTDVVLPAELIVRATS